LGDLFYKLKTRKIKNINYLTSKDLKWDPVIKISESFRKKKHLQLREEK